ncbi:MAG: PAS domain-containing protein [Rhodococcus sp. (in: high G+C Gram-positive bacteria)]
MALSNLDFAAIFEQSPANLVVVDTDFRIVAATDGYLKMVMRTREELTGKLFVEAFPDDPNDPDAKGNSVFLSAVEGILRNKKTEWIPGAVRYPVERPASEGGGYEERWFTAVNAPVLDENDEVLYVIHGNEDVTDSHSKG